MSHIELRTEASRNILFDLINFKKSGFSPFVAKSHQSKDFWKSRDEYKEVSFPAFQQQAAALAEVAISQMPLKDRREEEARIAKQNKASKPTNDTRHNPPCSAQQQHNNTRVQSLRDTYVLPYPNGDMTLIMFELDGDIDERACVLQFNEEGTSIHVLAQVPRELTNAASLLGNPDSRNSIQDADCMLLNQVIQQRLIGSQQDSSGNVWELREIIALPFECKKTLFNKQGKEIPTYLLRKNDKGYAWGYFWLMGKHVGKREEGPTKIRCKATSDDESDNEIESDENSSQLSSSDGEMDIEYESSVANNLEAKITELNNNLEAKILENLRVKNELETEICQLKQRLDEKSKGEDCANKKLGQLQNCLEAKNEEVTMLRKRMESEMSKLKQQYLDTEMQKTLEHQSDNEKHIERIQRLEMELNDFKAQQSVIKDLHANEKRYEKNLETQQLRIAELESKIISLTSANEQAMLLKDLRIQELEKTGRHNLELYQQQENAMKEKISTLESQLKGFERNNVRSQDIEQRLLAKDKECVTYKARVDELDKTLRDKDSEYQKQQDILVGQAKTQNGKIQELEGHLLEKDQQCCYQLDQIEKLTKQVFELEQLTEKQDQENKFYLHQIKGLKTHLQHQGDFIKRMEQAAKANKKCGMSLRLSNTSNVDQEQDHDFADLNQWESDESVSEVSPQAIPRKDIGSTLDGEKDEYKEDSPCENLPKESSSISDRQVEENADGNNQHYEQSTVLDDETNSSEFEHDDGSENNADSFEEQLEMQDGARRKESAINQNGSNPVSHQSSAVENDHHDTTISPKDSLAMEDNRERDQGFSEREESTINENGPSPRVNESEGSMGTLNELKLIPAEQKAPMVVVDHDRGLIEQTNQSRKRKSVGDQGDQPTKKLRKSRRLEEKRLAKQMKAKMD